LAFERKKVERKENRKNAARKRGRTSQECKGGGRFRFLRRGRFGEKKNLGARRYLNMSQVKERNLITRRGKEKKKIGDFG